MLLLKDQTIIDKDHFQEPKEDLIRIQKALFVHRDLFCSLDECGNIWQNYSWDLSASWLDIPDNLNEIIDRIEKSYSFTSFKDWVELKN